MANKQFKVPINLVNLASDPGTASEGDIYYNTADDVVKVYANGAWVAIGAGAGGGSTISVGTTEPTEPAVGDGWYDNTDGSFYLFDGTYWVEVNGIVSLSQEQVQDYVAPLLNHANHTNITASYDDDNNQILLTGSSAVSGALTGIDSITDPDYITFDTSPETSSSNPGTLSWNEEDGTLDLKLNSDITLQVGQELHVRVYNGTGSTIPNGTVVYVNGSSDIHGHISVAPYIADGSVNVFNVMGLSTSDILDEEDGYVTLSGLVRGLDTSDFNAGDSVFASDTIPGGLTTTQPISPSETVSLGVVTVSDATEGMIFVQIDTGATADLITYDHDTSLLEATNVAAALDELAYKKADINALSSSLVIYPTSVESNISGYYRMVESIDDADYNDTAVNISTGNLNGTGSAHLISSLVADANIFVGTPGSINVTTIGNIRKTSGNANAYSEFFFRLYKRTSGGTETLLGSSSTTGAVNPTTLNSYEQFSASGNFLISNFTATDRLVIKYYSNILDDGTQSYEFQFGGDQPVRTLIPVPISVTPASSASGTLVDTSSFNGVLSGADSTVQAALETIDDIVTIPDQSGHSGEYLSTNGSSVSWSSISFPDYSTTYQPLDQDLTDIAAIGGTNYGFLTKSVTGFWNLDTNTYLTYVNNSDGNFSLSTSGTTELINLSTNVTVAGDLVIGGDLTVNGTTTTLNTETLAIEDNIITLNSNVTGSPSTNAGVEVERGTSTNVSIRWNESSDVWEYTNDGTTYLEIGSGAGTTISSTAPSSPTEGMTWFNTTDNILYVYDGTYWIEVTSIVEVPYPPQANNAGKFLTTDGTDVSWASVDALPSQANNTGKYLTTNGTAASWADIAGAVYQDTAPTGVPTGTIWVDSDASSATINTNDFVLKSEAESYTPHGFLLMGA